MINQLVIIIMADAISCLNYYDYNFNIHPLSQLKWTVIYTSSPVDTDMCT